MDSAMHVPVMEGEGPTEEGLFCGAVSVAVAFWGRGHGFGVFWLSHGDAD